jgi:ELWxxDGT repeat protein
VTNGTSGGTFELGYPPGFAITAAPVVLGTKVLFIGSSYMLWATNGTAAGTVAVSGPNTHEIVISDLTLFGNQVLFARNFVAGNDGLWITDGTQAGTHSLLLSFLPNPSLSPNNITAFGSKAVFVATDSNGHPNLWITDGTSGGTTELLVAGTDPGGLFENFNSFSPDFTRLGSRMLFAGRDSSGNTVVWATDGTALGTTEISAAREFPGNPEFAVLGNVAVFYGAVVPGTAGLWVTDGTSAGSSELAPLNASVDGLAPQDITAFGTHALFKGQSAANNQTLWITDGTNLGTQVVVDFELNPQNITVAGGLAYFNGQSGGGSHLGLFVTDGTTVGTHELTVAGASPNGLNPQNMSAFGSLLMFNGTDASGQQDLWVTDGTSAGTHEIAVIGASPSGLAPSFLTGFTMSTAALNDFSGDGLADVLWRNADGTLAEWAMSGWQIGAGQPLTYQGNLVKPDTSWAVASVNDFNGDGIADILWRQASTGALVDWAMNGSQIQSSQYVTSQGNAVAPDSSWSILGTGDFNGDGMADILWRQGTGAIFDWTMNGSQIASSQAATSQGNVAAPDASWSVAGVADFNGDHEADLLWRQSGTGALVEWTMNGAQISASNNISYQNAPVKPDSSWTIAGLGDFDGDGKTDILWRQASTGALVEWTMFGPTVSAAGSTGNLTFQGNVVAPDASWSVVQIDDFNGDGRADVLWRQSTTGSLAEWIMGGSQILASQTVTSQSNVVAPDSSWHPQAFPTNAG